MLACSASSASAILSVLRAAPVHHRGHRANPQIRGNTRPGVAVGRLFCSKIYHFPVKTFQQYSVGVSDLSIFTFRACGGLRMSLLLDASALFNLSAAAVRYITRLPSKEDNYLANLKFEYALSGEMKFVKEESIQKLDQCGALFQIHLLVTQDLWRRISISVSQPVKLAHGSVFHLPAEERAPSHNDVSSRDRGSPHCRRSGE